MISPQVLHSCNLLTRVILCSSQQFLLSLIIQQHSRLIVDRESSPGDQPLLYPIPKDMTYLRDPMSFMKGSIKLI
jgi:hypothetical protein